MINSKITCSFQVICKHFTHDGVKKYLQLLNHQVSKSFIPDII